jgi:hypothetical protein
MRPRTTFHVALLGAFLLSSIGCVVSTRRGYPVSSAGPRCHPSQYWDGSQCRHKGRGHGARKHDGRWK